MSAGIVPASWSDAVCGLVPLLRTTTTPFDAVRSAEHTLVATPVGPSLHGLVAWEDDRVRLFLTSRHLARWGASAAEACARALEGVDPALGIGLGDDGLWQVVSPDGNASGRLLLPGFVEAFRGRVRGSPVVAVPHARCVLVGGAADREQVESLVSRAAREWRSEGDPISPVLYTASGGRLAPWWPEDAPSALGKSLRAAACALARREYGRLAEALDDEPWATFEVGVYAADAEGQHEAFSFVRWHNGDDVLVPIVDVVVLDEPGLGAWLAVPFAAWRAALGPRAADVTGVPLPAIRALGALSPRDVKDLAAFALPANRFGP